MPVIVQKFGGTSVSTQENRAAAVQRVVDARQQGNSVVVVVSAMGRKGDAYATDTLIGLVSAAGTTDLRELDMVMSCGELLSAGVFAAQLRKRLPKVVFLSGWQAGIITDSEFGNAHIVGIKPDRIQQLLSDGYVVVVAGFQGLSQSGEVTTLGRGGSDTTAAALGVALQADIVEIYTDVEGIMTADPSIVKDAKVLDVLDYSEVFQMANEGAKVIHPRAVELAMKRNIPLLVKHTKGNHPGTLIRAVALYETGRKRPVIGVTYRTQIAQVSLSPKAQVDPHLDVAIFTSLADQGISVDLINVCPAVKMFTVAEQDVEMARSILSELEVELRITTGCAKISVVGMGMRGVPGVMATVARAMQAANLQILQSSDSHMTISCLVDQKDMALAVNTLHSHFHLGSAN